MAATSSNPLSGVLEWRCRSAEPGDLGFIIETWSREAFDTHKDARLSAFRALLKSYIQRRLGAGDTAIVAHASGDREVLYGWIVRSESSLVRFVFVRREYRRCGVARDLVRYAGLKAPIQTSARLTAHAQSIKVLHKDQVLYLPFTEEL